VATTAAIVGGGTVVGGWMFGKGIEKATEPFSPVKEEKVPIYDSAGKIIGYETKTKINPVFLGVGVIITIVVIIFILKK
jgi:hypothetical protein